jgi:hypothetical protein
MTRRRAAPEPELHAGLDKFKRALRGLALQPIGILQWISSVEAAWRSPRRVLAAMPYRLPRANAN